MNELAEQITESFFEQHRIVFGEDEKEFIADGMRFMYEEMLAAYGSGRTVEIPALHGNGDESIEY